ncbi:MAG: Hsp20/alpha crystallin family protein [Oscillospiraceae bacterium]|nr:Hsp20/alpha crystallin family protein [Oscillospiraceae bacterium]
MMFDLAPFDLYNRFDDDFFRGKKNNVAPCRTDICDTGDTYIAQAELPGFSKEEIKISVEKDCLTIDAEHKEDAQNQSEHFIRRERPMNNLSRSFDISEIDAGKISAKLENGILTLTMPKKRASQPASTQISID